MSRSGYELDLFQHPAIRRVVAHHAKNELEVAIDDIFRPYRLAPRLDSCKMAHTDIGQLDPAVPNKLQRPRRILAHQPRLYRAHRRLLTSAFSTLCIFFLRVYLPNVSPDMISSSYQCQLLTPLKKDGMRTSISLTPLEKSLTRSVIGSRSAASSFVLSLSVSFTVTRKVAEGRTICKTF